MGQGVRGSASDGCSCYFGVMADHTFRLQHTPLGTLLVKFYQVKPYTPEGFQQRIATDFLATTTPGWGTGSWSLALFQGLINDASVLPEAVWRLAQRCPECNCVRIEQAH